MTTKDLCLKKYSFININGTTCSKDRESWHHICKSIQSNQINICGFLEINKDTTQYAFSQPMHQTCQQILSPFQFELGLLTTQSINQYKPGGTAQLAQANIVGCIQECRTNKMGRWSYFQLAKHNNKQITIILAYQL